MISQDEACAISEKILREVTLKVLVSASEGADNLETELENTLRSLFQSAIAKGVDGSQFGKMVMASGLACWSADVAIQKELQ